MSTFAPKSYRVVRFYLNKPGQHRTVINRCTLAEAQAHCGNPQTSSRTATNRSARACTKRNGPWFDGYEER
jgi:hypothetical protein